MLVMSRAAMQARKLKREEIFGFLAEQQTWISSTCRADHFSTWEHHRYDKEGEQRMVQSFVANHHTVVALF